MGAQPLLGRVFFRGEQIDGRIGLVLGPVCGHRRFGATRNCGLIRSRLCARPTPWSASRRGFPLLADHPVDGRRHNLPAGCRTHDDTKGNRVTFAPSLRLKPQSHCQCTSPILAVINQGLAKRFPKNKKKRICQHRILTNQVAVRLVGWELAACSACPAHPWHFCC